MPPTKRSPTKVPNTSCRVCASNNPVMLELFGSATQPVSYAEDVIKCLSLEVKQDDGLPSKICIKCAGVIGDYRPFVDKTLAAESERNSKCDSTSGSSSSCYFCLTSGTILFPVPEASINKSKDCFGIHVSGKEQICVRCQFLLEGLHEMKQKSSAASKQFSSNSLPVKTKFSPAKIKEEKRQSVEDIVDSSKDKIIPEKSKADKKMDKEVSVASKVDKEISVSSKVVKEEPVSSKVDMEESLSSRTDKEVSASSKAEKVMSVSSKADKEMSVGSKVDKEMSVSSKTVKKLSVVFKTDKDVCLCLQDIVQMFGEEFFRGTVSAAKVLARLHGSPQINGYEPVKVSLSKSSKELGNRKISKKNDKLSTSKKVSKLEKKSRRLSKVDIQTEADLADDKSSKSEDGTALEGRKRSRESSEPETDVSLKKTRRRSNSEKSEPEKSAADTTQDTLDKDPLTSEKDAIPEKEEDKPANESAGLVTESEEEIGKNREKKRGRKPKIKKEKTECESSSDVPPKPSQPSIVRPAADTSLTENGLDAESTRPKRKTKKVEFAMDHEDDNDDEPLKSGTRRKRRNSEDEFYHPKGKDRVKRKPRQSYNSEDENDADDPKENVTVDQPDYMNELDKLLESTPKNAFKPFICSVCHEGYISTVKGKLHKLVAHDPHSNLVLELTRCDHGKSGSDDSAGEIRVAIKVEAPSEDDPDKLVVDEDASARQMESGDAANDLDDLFDGEKSTPNPAQTASDFDDLFDGEKEKSAPNPAQNSEDVFNSLFGGTKTQDSDKDSAAANRIDTGKTIDKSSQSGKDTDSVDSDPLSTAVKEPEKSSEEEVSKVDCKEPSEEISKPESEKASEEEASKPDCEKSPEEEVSKPESEKSSAKKVSKPDCDKSSEEVVSKPDCEEPLEGISKPECVKSQEEEVSKSDSSEHTEEGTIKPAEDETSEPKCVKPAEVEENCEAGGDDVKENESEKDGSVEAPEPVTEMEVKEPLPETCNRPDSEEKAEGAKENSTSNDEEILNSEKRDQTENEQSTDKQNQAENEEAVSSSIVEDEVPSPVPAEEKRGDLQNNGSEADESDCGDSPAPVKNDVASEPSKKINDCVDSTTAALDIPHDKVEENLLISDKDVEPSSVVPDSSEGNYDGIVVGDD